MVVAPPPPPGLIVYDQVSLDGQHTFVFRERADGSRRVLVMRDAYDPVWSPDGRAIAAFKGRGIAIATADGRILRTIATIGSTAYLTWSPDGRWLAYIALHCDDPAAHQDPACGTLWVVRADGSGQRRASREDAVDVVHSFEKPYGWAPDGRRIAYTMLQGLVVSDILTARRHLLGPGRLIKSTPSWSPDARRLLYTYGSELVTSAPDGSARRRVDGARDTMIADWSPDGRRIAYIRQVTSEDWRLFVARPDGSARVDLAKASDAPLVWSPDGRYLLVGAGGGGFEIVAADGRGRPHFVRGGDDGDWG